LAFKGLNVTENGSGTDSVCVNSGELALKPVFII